jgi:hypothetical protein
MSPARGVHEVRELQRGKPTSGYDMDSSLKQSTACFHQSNVYTCEVSRAYLRKTIPK